MTRGIFSHHNGGKTEIREFFSHHNVGPWWEKTRFFPHHIRDPGGKKQGIFPTLWWEKTRQAGNFEDLGIRNAKFPLQKLF